MTTLYSSFEVVCGTLTQILEYIVLSGSILFSRWMHSSSLHSSNIGLSSANTYSHTASTTHTHLLCSMWGWRNYPAEHSTRDNSDCRLSEGDRQSWMWFVALGPWKSGKSSIFKKIVLYIYFKYVHKGEICIEENGNAISKIGVFGDRVIHCRMT